MANLTKFAGSYRALDYYYGGPIANDCPPPLTILMAPAATGSGSVTLSSGVVALTDGSSVSPLATTAPVLVGSGSNQETVTPSAVTDTTSSVPGQARFTATFSNLHGLGDIVASATCGLQEAINAASAAGGGTVVVDAAWANAGGTTAMIAAATVPAGVSVMDARTGLKPPVLPLAASGAINPHESATYVVTKAGVAALTLAAPTATTDDGVKITVTSNTADAHTLTATGLLQTGSIAVNLATFAADAGAGLTLMAYQGKWNVLSQIGITFS